MSHPSYVVSHSHHDTEDPKYYLSSREGKKEWNKGREGRGRKETKRKKKKKKKEGRNGRKCTALQQSPSKGKESKAILFCPLL